MSQIQATSPIFLNGFFCLFLPSPTPYSCRLLSPSESWYFSWRPVLNDHVCSSQAVTSAQMLRLCIGGPSGWAECHKGNILSCGLIWRKRGLWSKLPCGILLKYSLTCAFITIYLWAHLTFVREYHLSTGTWIPAARSLQPIKQRRRLLVTMTQQEHELDPQSHAGKEEWEFRAGGNLFQLSLPEGWPQLGWWVEQVGLTGKDGGKSSLVEGIIYSI